MQFALRRAPDGKKAGIEMQIEAIEDKMPAPLPAIYTVADRAAKIYVLGRGDYQNKVAKVGPRPLGIFLPEAAPEDPLDVEKPRPKLASWITDPSNPLTRPSWSTAYGSITSDAVLCIPRTTSAAWEPLRRTPPCWTTWRIS